MEVKRAVEAANTQMGKMEKEKKKIARNDYVCARTTQLADECLK
jgi:hypothetical protein